MKKFITAFSLMALSLQSQAFEFKQNNALPSEEAFKVFVEENDENITVLFDTERDYYLYKDKIEFFAGEEKIETTMPKGFMKDDSYFGNVEIYPLDFKVKIKKEQLQNSETLKIKHQGCAAVYDLCYVPRTDEFNI
jgi:thiol:disulfide interchange protein DsbD